MPEAPDNPLSSIPKPVKHSKQYRTSAYTVVEYRKLPYAEQRRVNAECDAGVCYSYKPGSKKAPTLLPPTAPLVFTRHTHPESGRDILVGSKKVKS